MSRFPRDLRRSGFTLLEVMVAIVIAGFTVASLYSIFTVQSRQLLTQDLHMEMSQNMRFATDVVSRSVRMAGYGTNGEVTGVFGPNGTSDETLPLPAILSWDADGANGTDAVTVVYADPAMLMDTQNTVVEACTTTTLTFRPGTLDYADKLAQFDSGDLLLCYDYADIRGTEAYLWTISSASAATGVVTVDSNAALTDYAAVCSSSENLTPILTCSRGQVLTYYVDDVDDGTGPGTPEHPVLMVDMNMSWPADDDVPLVDNIEDFQVEYCLDDGSSAVDCSDSTDDGDSDRMGWANDVQTTTDEAPLVWMVRLSMVVRSSREEYRDLRTSVRPGLANRSAGTTTDHYYRRVISTEVTVRNNRYMANL